MSASEQPSPYIAFKDVSKSFGDNHVLEHVNFDVLTGETVCILGRSGVGKSVTLQNIKPPSAGMKTLISANKMRSFTLSTIK